MTLEAYLKYLEQYLADYARPFNGYILGMSGGLDSALVAKIAKNVVKEKLYCVIIDIHNNEDDINDAKKFLVEEEIAYSYIDLSTFYDDLILKIEKETNKQITKISRENVAVRLRMVTLYALGQSMNKLVLGTTNKSEYYTGYYTKWGDGGVDVHVLIHLLKTEVYKASRIYNIPEVFINKKPSAGLTKNQTDEDDLGLTYEELDNFLLGEKVSERVSERAKELHAKTNHKRREIVKPKPFRE
jgi:NAD+ synthase